jgi:hypothetical protein
MKRIIIVLIILSVILAGCNLPRRSQTPSPEDVNTQVVELLTAIPTLTKAPTATQVPPTATSTPTPLMPTATFTDEPTSTSIPPTPAPTQPATDPRILLGEPTYTDAMDDGGGFFAYSDEHVKFDPQDDAMDMVAYNTDSWHGWSLAGTALGNAYIEMTAKPGACSGVDRYGLVLKSTDTNRGYFYGFSCDGRFSLRKWDGKDFTTIVDWTASEHITAGAGQTNRLGVKMEGNHFTFYANGAQIGEADDASFKDGKYGLFIAASETPNFSATVDQVDYWTLQ